MLQKLTVQLSENTFSKTQVCDWHGKFSTQKETALIKAKMRLSAGKFFAIFFELQGHISR